MTKDCAITIAEKLEKKGLWRRATRQWLEVMGLNLSVSQLDTTRQRQGYCLAQIKALKKPQK